MAFSEKTKDEVKRKAHFRCCVCGNYFVEIHHIIPEAHGGTDDIGNAAPLCPNCHSNFGDSPTRRKVITQMRDFWYELCEKSEMNPDIIQFSTKLDGLYEEFQKVKDNQQKQYETLTELRSHISTHFHKQADQISNVTSIEELITVSGSSTLSNIDEAIGDMPVEVCQRCGFAAFQSYGIYCSYCGARFI